MCLHITLRELVTILAALRYWQQDLLPCAHPGAVGGMGGDYFDDPLTPLTAQEIDKLCERLDCG